MPELPEVETLKKGLEKTILGKTIAAVEVRLPKIVSLGPKTVSNIRAHSPRTVQTFRRLLVGQRIKAIRRRAKMLILELSREVSLPRHPHSFSPYLRSKQGEMKRGSAEGNIVLLIHLKMTGQLIFAKKGEQKEVKIYNAPNSPRAILPHKYTHAIFKFTDGSKLYFNDLRQFGYLRLVRDREVASVKELQEYGPEPFDKEFTIDYLVNTGKRRPNLAVKQFLMDPKVVAGIGNIYSDEILYWAKLRPQRRLRSLNRAAWQALLRSIPTVLKEGLKYQGSSVGDFFKIDGSEGMYGKHHMVYGRHGEQCKVCGEKILSIKLGGRTSSYCPSCQK